jgi:hypothetical protein
LSSEEDKSFVDGAVIAAARTLPTWSEKDVPMIPSIERKSARELQEECGKILKEYSTTSQQDQILLGEFVILIMGAYFLCLCTSARRVQWLIGCARVSVCVQIDFRESYMILYTAVQVQIMSMQLFLSIYLCLQVANLQCHIQFLFS